MFEVSACFQDMCADIYSSLLKALEMPDNEDTSYHPVRVSAAGAIMELLEVVLQITLLIVLCGIHFCYSGFLLAFYVFLFYFFRMNISHLSGYHFFKL